MTNPFFSISRSFLLICLQRNGHTTFSLWHHLLSSTSLLLTAPPPPHSPTPAPVVIRAGPLLRSVHLGRPFSKKLSPVYTKRRCANATLPLLLHLLHLHPLLPLPPVVRRVLANVVLHMRQKSVLSARILLSRLFPRARRDP